MASPRYPAAMASPDPDGLAGLSAADKANLLGLIEEAQRRRQRRRFFDFYPDEGPLRRALYPRHMDFFAAGARYRERCFLAANRTGKTEGGGGYETTCHLTGLYPSWWTGRRFDAPIYAWMAGKYSETARDILQAKMLGAVRHEGSSRIVDGTGLVPGDLLGRATWKQGVPDMVDSIPVRHVSGGWSHLGIKSYQQGRGSFEGTEQHVIWLDEEPPMDIYGECLIRTGTTKGLIMLTFTPLSGISEVVRQFLPGGTVGDLG